MQLLKLLPRFWHAYRMLEPLAEREQWSRAQIEEYQLQQLNSLWRHAIQYVPYYRGLHQERDLPECFSNLEQFKQTVPLLSKPAVRENPEQFLSSQAKFGRWERTSGSTGAPTRIFHDTASHRMMLHAKYRLYQCWGVDILDRTAYLWDRADLLLPTWESLLRRTRYKIFDLLRGRLRLSAFKLDRRTLAEHLRAIERFRPRMLYGFSNALYQLAQAALEQGFRCDSVKAVVMTAEPASPAMLATVAEAFGAPAAIEYGATECELIAGMQPDGTLRVREDLVLVETLPHSLGGYEFVITVLANDSFPLFRYRLEDLTDCPLNRPERGFAILSGGVRGRQDDLLQTSSGGYLHSSSIDALFEHVWDSGSIRRYRVHQRACGTLEVQIEIDPQRSTSLDLHRMESDLSRLVEGFPVRIDLTANLDTRTAAKQRTITSELIASSAGSRSLPLTIEEQ